MPGIVTAVRAAGASRGFFLQDPDAGADAATSEGIFVSSAPRRAWRWATRCSSPHDNPLPAPQVIAPDTVPAAYAPDLGGGNIEATARSALDVWESREGMRVEVDDARVVGPSNAFGEQYVTTKPSQAPTYRGGTELLAENAIPSDRVEVVPVDGSKPVIANHFNSKGGDGGADGRFQFLKQSSAVQRAGQAQVVHDLVAHVLAVQRRAGVVVLGDLNDFQFSPGAGGTAHRAGGRLGPVDPHRPHRPLPVEQQYTYVFNGVAQVLDHILVSPALERVQYQVVHVNAEYADQASDHDPQVVRLRP